MRRALFLLLLCGTAGPPDDAAQSSESEADRVVLDGVWPTSTMLENLLVRWADDTALKYDLNDEQAATTRRAIVRRWSSYLTEHREDLQPLLNEYVEARFAPSPPDAEAIQRWAKRADPVFDSFREQIDATQTDIGDVLTPAQRVRHALEGIKINTSLGLFKARLDAWERGEFDERDWWEPTKRVRQEREKAAETAKESATASDARSRAAVKIDEELARWDSFVADFILKYALDDRQREAAFSILRECKKETLAYRDRHRTQLEQLEETIDRVDDATGSLSDPVRSDAVKLYGPIDRIFADLRARIEQIPTLAQRASAEVNSPAPSTPATSPTDAKKSDNR